MLFSAKGLLVLSLLLVAFSAQAIDLALEVDCAKAAELTRTMDAYEFSLATHALVAQVDPEVKLQDWHRQIGIAADRLETYTGDSFGVVKNYIISLVLLFTARAKVKAKNRTSGEYLLLTLGGALNSLDFELAMAALRNTNSTKEFENLMRSQSLAIERYASHEFNQQFAVFVMVRDADGAVTSIAKVGKLTDWTMKENVKPQMKTTLVNEYFLHPGVQVKGVEIQSPDTQANRAYVNANGYLLSPATNLFQLGSLTESQRVYFAGTNYPLVVRLVPIPK